MNRITLTSEELSLVTQAQAPVAIQDEEGRVRGYIAMVIDCEELAEAKKALASPGRRYTTAEVLAELRARSTP